MKRIHLKITILVLLVVSFSCDKYLDLEPYQSISEEKSLETDANVKNALIGAYTQFDDPAIYGGNILRNSERYIWKDRFLRKNEIWSCK